MRKGLLVLMGFATVLFCAGCSHTSAAAKTCRADAQKIAEETDSYDAEYDSLYGATTLGQRPVSELFDRGDELIRCIDRDPKNQEQYRALLDRTGFVESSRYLKFLLETEQLPDFAQWEKNQQATQLASYRKGGPMKPVDAR